MNMQGKIKHIVILVHPYSTLLNISAPVEAFQTAINHFDQVGRDVGFTYQLHIVSADTNHTVGMSPGVVLTCESSYREITYPVDTLIVAGAPRKNGVANDVLLWLKEQSQTVRRICAMCAGAFILAEAGVLINKRATTHWMLCEEMARTYPQTIVNPEAIFVKDGNVYTSAGVTAGLDLALAFIEEDLGRTFALHVARIMVLFLKRPGNQTQYSAMLESQQTDHQPLNNAIRWICDHLQQPEITVEQLAAQSRMSPRNFARVFVRELHITPIKYVEKLRLEAACRYLTDTRLNMDEIARLCGWKNSNNMNRIFLKTFNTSPSQYRRNFSSSFS